jgi:hypothetical protein
MELKEMKNNELQKGSEYIICYRYTKKKYKKLIYREPHELSENHYRFIDKLGSIHILHKSFIYYSVGRILVEALSKKIPNDDILNEISLYL